MKAKLIRNQCTLGYVSDGHLTSSKAEKTTSSSTYQPRSTMLQTSQRALDGWGTWTKPCPTDLKHSSVPQMPIEKHNSIEIMSKLPWNQREVWNQPNCRRWLRARSNVNSFLYCSWLSFPVVRLPLSASIYLYIVAIESHSSPLSRAWRYRYLSFYLLSSTGAYI